MTSHVGFVGVLFIVWGLLTTLIGVSTLALGVGAFALITSASPRAAPRARAPAGAPALARGVRAFALIPSASRGGGAGGFAAGVPAAVFTTLAIIAILWG